jgi:hypothetical protein
MTETRHVAPLAARASASAAQPWLGGFGRALALLFPAAPPAQPGPRPWWRRRPAAVGLGIAVVAAGAEVLLIRQAGTPAWQTVWAEDGTVFLPRALAHPWLSLGRPFAGYQQLVAQLIADLVAAFPLRYAAAGFAVAGAVVASASALFAGHASAGHVHRPELRVLLGASVLLLPTALIEIANSGVDAQWYLMYALFWALLWRPRTGWGQAAAAAAAFAAMATNILNLLYLPLAAARVIALPRRREHTVTWAWLAGVAFQVTGLLQSRQPRHHGPLGTAVHYYGQHVLVAAVFGWRLALRLQDAIGVNAVIALAVIVVGALAGAAVATRSHRVQAFTVTALVMGIILTIVPVLIRHLVGPAPSTALWVPGSRYTASAILLIDAIAIVGIDGAFRRQPDRPLLDRTGPDRTGPDRTGPPAPRRLTAALAAGLLVTGLGLGWSTSFRYDNSRSSYRPWSQTYQRYARPDHAASQATATAGRPQ